MAGYQDAGEKDRHVASLAPGTIVSHYRIVKKIGAGGMGEVYFANDDLLERPVAIKFLSVQQCASEQHRRRFLRGAKAAARLRHPNIVLTLDLGEHDGIPYIIFEYVDPHTLRDRMTLGALTLDEIQKISIGLAEAIAAAHSQGVIHRDIKPSNILLDTHGNPKLVDFGLAVLADAKAETRTAGIAGTIGYMSPEQVRGAEVDERSDLFSLGVVMYEMITGVNPFLKETEVSSLNALLNDEPEPLRHHRVGVPPRLEDIVLALLQKDPSLRYQCASHLHDDLLGCNVSEVVLAPLQIGLCAPQNRLAILPFDLFVSGESDNRLGEMMAHLLITGLSDITELSIVSGQRLFDLLTLEGRREVDAIDRSVATRLARRAEARWMLQGAVMSQAPLVLTTQLVDVDTGLLVKGHRFALNIDDSAFDAADQILETLREDLASCNATNIAELVPVKGLTTSSLEALHHYLSGFQMQARWNEEKAKEEYEQAIACDPMFAMAYYGLASIPVPNRMALIEKAENLAERATFRERCYIRALHLRLKGDRLGSMAVLRELLERHDDEKLAYFWIGVNLHYLNEFEEAINYLNKAIELDPLFTPAYNQLVYTHNRAGNFEESMVLASQLIQLAPTDSNPYDTRAEVLGFNGRLEAALMSYREALARQPVLAPSLQNAGILYLLKQDYDHARELFDRLWEYVPDNPWVDPHVCFVDILLRQGKWRQALEYLDHAIAEDSLDERKALHSAYKREVKSIIFLEMKMNAESLVEIEAALPTFQGDVWFSQGMHIYLLYSWILARNGHLNRAREVVESQVGPGGNREVVKRMRHLLALGLIALEAGDMKEAIALLEGAEAVRPRWLSPEHFLLQGTLARVCLLQGRLDRAVELLEAALHVFAGARKWQILSDVKHHYFLGMAFERSGWKTKAIDQYRMFLDIWKDADAGFDEISDAKSRLVNLEGNF